MNTQAPQPVQSANVGTQPNLPAPQQPGFMQQDPNNMTFGIDPNSGELMLVPINPPAQPTQEATNLTEVPTDDIRFQNAVEDAKTQTVQEPNPLQDRVDKMEGMMNQLGMLLQGMLTGQGLSNLPNQQQQQQAPTLPDLNELDSNGLQSFIANAINSAMEKRLGPMQQTQQEIVLRQQFNDAYFKYGQEFLTLAPAMVELKKSDPNISWDTAFAAIKMGATLLNKKTSTTSDSTIQTGNGSNGQQRQPQPAQALIAKAAQLATETNGTPRTVVNQEQKISTVDAAFEKAWSQMMGS